mgnify:CR=1 FL=1
MFGRPDKGWLISQAYILKIRVNWVLLKKFRLSRVPGSVLWIDKSWLCEAPVQKNKYRPNFKFQLIRRIYSEHLLLSGTLFSAPFPPTPRFIIRGVIIFSRIYTPVFLHIVDITIEQWYMEIVGKYYTRTYKHLFISCGGHLRVTSVGHQVTYYLKEPCRQLASS